MSFFETLMSYKSQKKAAKAARRMQAYRNKMTNISNAINQNAITQNTTLAMQQSAKRAVQMRKDELGALGSTAVSAAAAGVRGNSVNATLLNVSRNAGLLEKQRSDDLQNFFLQTHQQRLGSALQAVQNQDLTFIPKPSLGAMLLKDAVNTAIGFATGGVSGASTAAVGFDVTKLRR